MLKVIGVKNFDTTGTVYEFIRDSATDAPTAADFAGLSDGSVCHVVDDGESAVTLYDEYLVGGTWTKIGDKEPAAEVTEG